MNTSIDEQILSVLHWAYVNPAQELRLLTAVQVWLNDNDDSKSTAEALAEKFMQDNDPEKIAVGTPRPKIVEARTILTQNGLHVTFWRSDGSDRTYYIGYNQPFPDRILKWIRCAADVQETIAKRQSEPVLVRWMDLDGIPRAWATGPRASLVQVQQLAKENLMEYLIKKDKDGLPFGPMSDYEEVIMLASEV